MVDGEPSDPIDRVGRPSVGGTIPPMTAKGGMIIMGLKYVGQVAWPETALGGQPLHAGAFKVGSRYQTGRMVGVPSILCVACEFTYYCQLCARNIESGLTN